MSKNYIIYTLTFIVAFCSIVYELIYSQALTILFGGTVVRYSITIGLFLFSLGIGSFLFKYFDERKRTIHFYLIEITLSLLGFFGLLFIIYINSIPYEWKTFFLFISHIPIIAVGILSGLEIPFLSSMIERKHAFSEVLGFDYIGSLFGTIIYALFLYPNVGIISAALFIGFLNLFVALLFISYSNKRRMLYIGIFLFLLYLFALFNHVAIQENVKEVYLKSEILSDKENVESLVILESFSTPYQDIILYNISYTSSLIPSDTCLNLDNHVQLCDSWVDSYHRGLIDTPLTFQEEEANILLVGGGDWIPSNYLNKYGVQVDHVDIDEEFTEYTKNHPFFMQYHNNSYNTVNTIIEDAFFYLKNNEKKYDLIILDLPGAKHDKLLHLFSIEFYSFIYKSLQKDGMFITWKYPDHVYEEHSQSLYNTIREAGFRYHYPYTSTTEVDGEVYSREHYSIYAKTKMEGWEEIPYTENVKVNSIFLPNYDIIIG